MGSSIFIVLCALLFGFLAWAVPLRKHTSRLAFRSRVSKLDFTWKGKRQSRSVLVVKVSPLKAKGKISIVEKNS
jgi:hypothetical protein